MGVRATQNKDCQYIEHIQQVCDCLKNGTTSTEKARDLLRQLQGEEQ